MLKLTLWNTNGQGNGKHGMRCKLSKVPPEARMVEPEQAGGGEPEAAGRKSQPEGEDKAPLAERWAAARRLRQDSHRTAPAGRRSHDQDAGPHTVKQDVAGTSGEAAAPGHSRRSRHTAVALEHSRRAVRHRTLAARAEGPDRAEVR